MTGVDTSREAVERLAKLHADASTTMEHKGFRGPAKEASLVAATLRALLAERDAAVSKEWDAKRRALALLAERDAERKLRRAAQDLGQKHDDERDRLAAEAERMREALRNIEDWVGTPGPVPWKIVLDEARAALGTGGTP